MRCSSRTIAGLPLLAFSALAATSAGAQDLSSFAVLAGSTVTNTNPSVITGNVGVSPGTAVVGFFPPGVVVGGTIHINDGVAAQAQADLTTAYNVLANRPPTDDLTGQDLGGLTLGPGVYSFDTSAQLTGDLTLDAGGDPDAVFIFVIDSTLTTAPGARVLLEDGAVGANVYFVVGSSATLDSSTEFVGNIYALTSITLVTSASIDCGAALARNGAVTLDNNVISICPLAAVVIGDELDDSASDTAVAVGAAIDAFVDGGGTLPFAFQVLDLLTPTELAAALEQLSGEAGAGVAPAGTQAMNSFLTLALRAGSPGPSGGSPSADINPGETIYGASRGPEDDTLGTNTVEALGYGEEAPSSGAFASFGPAPAAAPDPRLWEVWAAGYYGQSDTDGDPAAGTHDRSASVFGMAAGVDYYLRPDLRIGVAIGGGGTSFGLAEGFGGGESDMVQVALSTQKTFGSAYLAAVIAYAFHDVTTDRFVDLGGLHHYTAEFSAHNLGARIEVGKRIGSFVPYGAVQVQGFFSPSYSETTESGTTSFALDYHSDTTITVRTEIGARVDRSVALDNGSTLTLQARAAWAHDFWFDPGTEAGFQSMPGSTFTVEGTEPAADSFLFSAGAEIRFLSGFAIAASLDTEFGGGSETYTGKGRISYAW